MKNQNKLKTKKKGKKKIMKNKNKLTGEKLEKFIKQMKILKM